MYIGRNVSPDRAQELPIPHAASISNWNSEGRQGLTVTAASGPCFSGRIPRLSGGLACLNECSTLRRGCQIPRTNITFITGRDQTLSRRQGPIACTASVHVQPNLLPRTPRFDSDRKATRASNPGRAHARPFKQLPRLAVQPQDGAAHQSRHQGITSGLAGGPANQPLTAPAPLPTIRRTLSRASTRPHPPIIQTTSLPASARTHVKRPADPSQGSPNALTPTLATAARSLENPARPSTFQRTTAPRMLVRRE